MTTTTLRPTGTVTAASSLTGGATTHACTNDDSDASYATVLGAGGLFEVSLGTVSLPAGAVMKSATVRARVKSAANPFGFGGYVVLPSGTWATFITSGALSTGFITFTATGPATWTQADIDGANIKLVNVGGGAQTADTAELYLDVTYALIPVTNVTYPTGTPAITTTNTPTYTWSYTQGSDGGAQSHYEVKVYTAAQYGAGGFSPDTSTTFWTSGIVVGSGTSQVSGVLTNSTTYRVYVRTAQTINGAAHWSAWDFEGFSISVTTADVSAITTTADSAHGRILIAVDRSGSAWNFVEVQRSTDAGTTWEYVRGGEYVNPAITTKFSTGDANNFDIYDYVSANAESTLYRARATRIVSGLPITGAWVQSSPQVAWSSTDFWIKAPNAPALNSSFLVRRLPDPVRKVRRGVFPVLGGRTVAISDARQQTSGELLVQTTSEAHADALLALIEEPVLLFQSPPDQRFGSRYVSVGDVTEMHLDGRVVLALRHFALPYDEVAAPAASVEALSYLTLDDSILGLLDVAPLGV